MKLRVHGDAQEELRSAMVYYENCRAGLGKEFHERVAASMLAIRDNPLQFAIYEGQRLRREYRRARVAWFPFIVVFQIRHEEILVVAVAHTSRAAAYWKKRN